MRRLLTSGPRITSLRPLLQIHVKERIVVRMELLKRGSTNYLTGRSLGVRSLETTTECGLNCSFWF